MAKETCPHCGGSTPHIYPANQSLYECSHCGTLYQNPDKTPVSETVNARTPDAGQTMTDVTTGTTLVRNEESKNA